MPQFNPIGITSHTVKTLEESLRGQEKVFAVETDTNSSLLICYSLSRELGGANDELAQFILDDVQQSPVSPQSLESEIGIYGGEYCLRISSNKAQQNINFYPSTSRNHCLSRTRSDYFPDCNSHSNKIAGS